MLMMVNLVGAKQGRGLERIEKFIELHLIMSGLLAAAGTKTIGP